MIGDSAGDAALVRRLRDGDDDLFAALARRWSPGMLRLARRHVRTVQSAEDIVQDTWLSVLSGLPAFEGRCSLRTWVFRILVNKAVSCGVHEHRTLPWTAAFAADHGAGTSMARPDGWRAVPPRPSMTPEDELLTGEVRGLIADAVRDLPARQRAVLELRDVHGLTADEACRLLGVSAPNQRVLLHRARAAVRARVAGYHTG